jgi:hypothetical protein
LPPVLPSRFDTDHVRGPDARHLEIVMTLAVRGGAMRIRPRLKPIAAMRRCRITGFYDFCFKVYGFQVVTSRFRRARWDDPADTMVLRYMRTDRIRGKTHSEICPLPMNPNVEC